MSPRTSKQAPHHVSLVASQSGEANAVLIKFSALIFWEVHLLSREGTFAGRRQQCYHTKILPTYLPCLEGRRDCQYLLEERS